MKGPFGIATSQKKIKREALWQELFMAGDRTHNSNWVVRAKHTNRLMPNHRPQNNRFVSFAQTTCCSLRASQANHAYRFFPCDRSSKIDTHDLPSRSVAPVAKYEQRNIHDFHVKLGTFQTKLDTSKHAWHYWNHTEPPPNKNERTTGSTRDSPKRLEELETCSREL